MEADIIVTCPYNPAHRIRKFKLMSHMAKCKKTSKVVDKVECPLDMSHVVDRDCLKEHIKSCTSLGKLIDLDSGYTKPKDVRPPIIENAYDTTENWEEEPEVPSYDPMEVSSKKPVMRCISGLTKSEKKKFKDSERMRIANLKGFHSASIASAFMKDTVYEGLETPLRPPRDTDVSPTRILDNDKKMHNHDDHNINVQAKFVPEFNTFNKILYEELAPEEDNIKLESLHSIDTKISLKDYFQHVSRENGKFSKADQNQETKFKNTETGATSKLFNIDNGKKDENECIASTSNVSGERVTDKLLALLKHESNIKKQSMKETTGIEQMNKESSEKEPVWNEMFSQFNERLTYLTDIQSVAAEESARILEQLKEFKLREEIARK